MALLQHEYQLFDKKKWFVKVKWSYEILNGISLDFLTTCLHNHPGLEESKGKAKWQSIRRGVG